MKEFLILGMIVLTSWGILDVIDSILKRRKR